MPLDKDEIPVGDLLDSKRAEYLAKNLKPILAFDAVSERWYRFHKTHWKEQPNHAVFKLIHTRLDSYIPGGFSTSRLRGTEWYLSVLLSVDNWEQPRNLLPLQNGVLNMDTGELKKHSYKHRFKWVLPYDYDPGAECPVFEKWLSDTVTDGPAAVTTLRAAMHFAVTGMHLIQQYAEIIGPGHTGKSTWVRVLKDLVGVENTAVTDLTNLEKNRFEVASFRGKRVVFINDAKKYGGEVANLKALTGDDAMRAEEKNKQQGGNAFVADFLLVITANQAIQSTDYVKLHPKVTQ